MRSLVGNMAIDDKFFKEIFIERLPTSVQTIWASSSDDLDISKVTDRMMVVDCLSSTMVAQVPQPITVSTSDLAELKTQVAQLSATVAALQLRRSTVSSRRFIDRVLRGLPFVYAHNYDVLVASRDVEEHLQHLTLIFDRFQPRLLSS
ncbi:hypothetical protein SprV_0200933700 [Sparganum proliferum]